MIAGHNSILPSHALGPSLETQRVSSPFPNPANSALPFSVKGQAQGLKFVHFIHGVFRQATDPTLVLPMFLAAPAYQLGKATALRGLLAQGEVNWLSRGLSLKSLPVLAGFGAESALFTLGARSLTHWVQGPVSWDPASMIGDWAMAGMTLGLMKAAGFLGRKGSQWARGLNEFQPLPFRPTDLRAQFWISQVSGYLGLVTSHALQNKIHPTPGHGNENIWLNALGTHLALGMGAYAGRPALGARFQALEQNINAQAHHLYQETKPQWRLPQFLSNPWHALPNGRGGIRGPLANTGLPEGIFAMAKNRDTGGPGVPKPSLPSLKGIKKTLTDSSRDQAPTLSGLEHLVKISVDPNPSVPKLQGTARQLYTDYLRQHGTLGDVLLLRDTAWENYRHGKEIDPQLLTLEGLSFHPKDPEIKSAAQEALEFLQEKFRTSFREKWNSVDGFEPGTAWLGLENSLENFNRMGVSESVWLLLRLAQHRGDPDIITQLRTYPHPLVRLDLLSTLRGRKEIYGPAWEDYDRYSIPDSLTGRDWLRNFYARRLLEFYSWWQVEEAREITPALDSIFPGREELGQMLSVLASTVPPETLEAAIPSPPPLGRMEADSLRPSSAPPDPTVEGGYYEYVNDRHASDEVFKKIRIFIDGNPELLDPELTRDIQRRLLDLTPQEKMLLTRKLCTLALSLYQNRQVRKRLVASQMVQMAADQLSAEERAEIYNEVAPAMTGIMERKMSHSPLANQFLGFWDEAGRMAAQDLILWNPQLSERLDHLEKFPESATPEDIETIKLELHRYRNFPSKFLPLSEALTRIALTDAPVPPEIRKTAARILTQFRSREVTEEGIQNLLDLFIREGRKDQALRYTLLISATSHENPKVRQLSGKGLDYLVPRGAVGPQAAASRNNSL